MELPTPADIARQIPAMVAEAGGSLDLLDLERGVSREFWPRIQTLKGDGGVDYLRQAFNDAIAIVIRNALMNSSGTLLLLTDKGWEQASVVRADSSNESALEVGSDEAASAGIDMTYAAPVIEHRLLDSNPREKITDEDLAEFGVEAFVVSDEDAATKIHNDTVKVHPRAYLDAVHAGCYYERVCPIPDEPHALAGSETSFSPGSLTERQREDAAEYRFRHGDAASRAFVKVVLQDHDVNHLVRFVDGSTEAIGEFVRRVLTEPHARLIRGHLLEDAREYHGRPLTMPATELLDRLYRAEIDGEQVDVGFHTALRQHGMTRSAADILMNECHIRFPGLESQHTPQRALRRVGRRRGASWARVVCELIAEAGGHADWPTITDAAERRPEAENDIGWREEIRQALRNNTDPAGRCYFEAAQIGEKAVYALTKNGRRLASRRTLDDRAPTLSKYLAVALDSHGDSQLTDLELYTMLFLACRLGRTSEAQTIYYKLPPDFPDEDSYAMIPIWIEQAESAREED